MRGVLVLQDGTLVRAVPEAMGQFIVGPGWLFKLSGYTSEYRDCRKYVAHEEHSQPRETCVHSYLEPAMGGLTCLSCDTHITGESLEMCGYRRAEPCNRKGNDLADECQRLADENMALRAEVLRLERRLPMYLHLNLHL